MKYKFLSLAVAAPVLLSAFALTTPVTAQAAGTILVSSSKTAPSTKAPSGSWNNCMAGSENCMQNQAAPEALNNSHSPGNCSGPQGQGMMNNNSSGMMN